MEFSWCWQSLSPDFYCRPLHRVFCFPLTAGVCVCGREGGRWLLKPDLCRLFKSVTHDRQHVDKVLMCGPLMVEEAVDLRPCRDFKGRIRTCFGPSFFQKCFGERLLDDPTPQRCSQARQRGPRGQRLCAFAPADAGRPCSGGASCQPPLPHPKTGNVESPPTPAEPIQGFFKISVHTRGWCPPNRSKCQTRVRGSPPGALII